MKRKLIQLGSDGRKIKLFILPDRIQKKRLEIIRDCAHSNGLVIASHFEQDVTHVLSELETVDQVRAAVPTISSSCKCVKLQWLFDTVKEEKLLPESGYLLQDQLPQEEVQRNVFDVEAFNKCIAERRAPLDNPNSELAAALELMHIYWTLMGKSVVDENRALAFRRAAAAIKCIPFRIKNIESVRGIKDLGEGHALRIVRDVVEEGRSSEVEEKKNEEKYVAMRLFANVFGVGPATARKWYDTHSMRTMDNVREHFAELDMKDERIKYGVAFYEDLNSPLQLNVARSIAQDIETMATEILDGVTVEIMGGFRRGKSSGHDLDLLLSHPIEGKEVGLLPKLYLELQKRGYIEWGNFQNSTFSENALTKPSGSSLDHFERCFCIFRHPPQPQLNKASTFRELLGPRDWRAVRVDLVVTPRSQHPFAVVGWTGNQWYNRALRMYAGKKGFILSSHGLYDLKKQEVLRATSEEEVFQLLGLEYRNPNERNF